VSVSTNTIETLANQEYKWGFVTDIEADAIPRGLNEGVIHLISAKKNEPEWLLEWRLKAYRHWLTMKEPTWGQRPLPGNRLPGHHLLLLAKGEEGQPQEP
jgi:Fe-S cluster assembly protein SufB